MSQKTSPLPVGTVFIVGSGPGDLDLLTLRAARLIGEADAVVYDHLIAEGVLELARPDAEKIYVGKKSSNHTVPQDELNRLLVDLARAGKKVVRLKGGDPFVFGRGGEEIETLVDSAIPFEVVPGVTAAAGCAAYAGIPLTHRDHAQAVAFATGHLKDGTINLDWPALARPRLTVVFYMGVGGIAEICRQMISHGLPPSHPAAVVQHGTTRRQRVLAADLATLPEKVAAAGIASPALIIVGTVVSLQPKLAWFQPQPSGDSA
ncbi:uroporphyrinogen-III C-methyltransferase [Accumulibacter sp.]|uniref:uroporphyrinogen-III C-methyltransferase n=1 Tax=Accumulibacter sp. TaxID=2053492 RepID=UPI001D34525A|nr:uroporphyrinogen-III C-methyltransferase [Accumulibacter sp.]MCB1932638.1 uroporphyrinogen-III C-methyltransferase [Accumulibacter sp.]MCP5228996.1 uroporphyrinogen-III C-methyltransferase [Accumulibacter sp.]